jgi:hypothetical protein
MRIGNTQELLNATRAQAASQLDLQSLTFTPDRRERLLTLVGHSMAELSWNSDTSPNDPKRYEIKDVAHDSAKIIVDAAVKVAEKLGDEMPLRDLVASPELRELTRDTRLQVVSLWDRHTRGR